MDLDERTARWTLLRHLYVTHDQQPGAGFPTVSALASAVGMSAPGARRLVDQCVQAKLAYLFANVADPCIGLTDAGRGVARRRMAAA
jgi:hypothetical protein